MLLTWVIDKFCPQFFISKENLFAGKVTAQNNDTVQSILLEMVENIVPALLRVKFDSLGLMLQTKLSKPPSTVPVLDSFASLYLIRNYDYEWHSIKANYTKMIQLEYKTTKSGTLIHSIYLRIELLKRRLRQSDKHAKLALKMVIEILTCWLGSLVASVSLSKKMGIPRQAIQLFRTGTRSDVATMLKLASVFYCNGDLDKVDRMLETVEKRFHSYTLQINCICDPQKDIPLFLNLHVLTRRKTHDKPFAYCVRFSVQEIHCTPAELRHEFFRSVGEDAKNRHIIYDNWMDLAVVDCLPYLHYLQYMTYRQLGKHDLQKRSLHNLDCCVRQEYGFGHLETAWNLLGQCMELEQEPEDAMVCYRTSLKIRSRNNAANWHVAILCYRLIIQANLIG